MTHSTPFTQNFLDSILLSIDSKDPGKFDSATPTRESTSTNVFSFICFLEVVVNAWLDTLLDVIELLPIEVLGKEVLEIAVNKAADSQPVFSRLGSCRLIGKLGMRLEQQVYVIVLFATFRKNFIIFFIF